MITGGRIPEKYVSVYLIINPMATYITMVRSAFTGEPLGIPIENLVFTIGSTKHFLDWSDLFHENGKKGGEIYMSTKPSNQNTGRKGVVLIRQCCSRLSEE